MLLLLLSLLLAVATVYQPNARLSENNLLPVDGDQD